MNMEWEKGFLKNPKYIQYRKSYGWATVGQCAAAGWVDLLPTAAWLFQLSNHFCPLRSTRGILAFSIMLTNFAYLFGQNKAAQTLIKLWILAALILLDFNFTTCNHTKTKPSRFAKIMVRCDCHGYLVSGWP